jgi:hypothetical protein
MSTELSFLTVGSSPVSVSKSSRKCGHCRIEGHTIAKCPTKPAAGEPGAVVPTPSAKSLAASEGNKWEVTFANVRLQSPDVKARFSEVTGCGDIMEATPSGLERNATDVKVEGTVRTVNCQVKSAKNDSFNGHWHRCDQDDQFYPADPSITKRVTDHVRLTVSKGDAKPVHAVFSDEETTMLIRHILAGDKPAHEPQFLVVTFDRNKPSEESYICPMERVVEWMTTHLPEHDTRMPIARQHGTVNLCGSRGSLEGLTLQRRGGEGHHPDGTPKGHPDAIQTKIKLKKGSELLKLFTKLS